MLTARELATLLAALRHWQQTYSETDIPSLITAWPQFAADAPLSSAEIDTLCARLNQLCGCESPGPFCCGIPGILARVVDARINPQSVERCDECELYASDAAARARLQELKFLS